jgi:hypothetical protein
MSAKGFMTPNQRALMVMAMLDDGFLSVDRSDPPDPDLRGLIDGGLLRQARSCKRDFPSDFYELTPLSGFVKTAGGLWEWPIAQQAAEAGLAALPGDRHGPVQ